MKVRLVKKTAPATARKLVHEAETGMKTTGTINNRTARLIVVGALRKAGIALENANIPPEMYRNVTFIKSVKSFLTKPNANTERRFRNLVHHFGGLAMRARKHKLVGVWQNYRAPRNEGRFDPSKNRFVTNNNARQKITESVNRGNVLNMLIPTQGTGGVGANYYHAASNKSTNPIAYAIIGNNKVKSLAFLRNQPTGNRYINLISGKPSYGSAMLKRIIQNAGKPIKLSAVYMPQNPARNKLIGFYRHFGFKANGNNSNAIGKILGNLSKESSANKRELLLKQLNKQVLPRLSSYNKLLPMTKI